MDRINLENVKQLSITEEERNKVALLLENNDVPYPYFGNYEGLIKVFNLIDNPFKHIINKLLNSPL